MTVNANMAKYETFEILGRKALFTPSRIDRSTVPAGLYAYDLRHSDNGSGMACELKDNILVNHLGTVLTREAVSDSDKGVALNYKKYNFLGERTTLDEFLHLPL